MSEEAVARNDLRTASSPVTMNPRALVEGFLAGSVSLEELQRWIHAGTDASNFLGDEFYDELLNVNYQAAGAHDRLRILLRKFYDTNWPGVRTRACIGDICRRALGGELELREALIDLDRLYSGTVEYPGASDLIDGYFAAIKEEADAGHLEPHRVELLDRLERLLRSVSLET